MASGLPRKKDSKKEKKLAVISITDPQMFGRPGSVIICTDPDLDPSINKQKTLISTVLLLPNDFLSLTTDMNVPTVSRNMHFVRH
jgi:hypothetical protein